MDEGAAVKQSQPVSAIAPMLVVLAGVKLLVHLLTATRYGMFRDELYYLDCADHLGWGYVDHPPLSIAVLAGVRALFGDSQFVLRALAAVFGAVHVVLTGLLARELGGGRFAQALAALAALAAPVYLGLTSFYSMNVLDLGFWTACALLAARAFRSGDGRLWLWFGLVAGLGLMNKISVGFFGFGLLVGLVLTDQRRWLADGRLWLGGLLAVALFVPYVLWQIPRGWPTLEFIHNAETLKNRPTPPGEFLLTQLLDLNPVAAPLGLAGLGWLLLARRGRSFRALGLLYLALLALFLTRNAKAYYLAPAHSILFAAGAVAVAGWTERRQVVRWVAAVLLIVSAGALAPLAMPVLPVEAFLRYQAALGVQRPQEERSRMGALPQHFADRFGWEEMVAGIAKAYQALPEQERAKAYILADNYGEAGAIDYYGPRYGLPKAICGHNSHWLWGPRGFTGEVLIAYGPDREDLAVDFEEVTEAGVFEHPYVMPYENGQHVYVCRRLKISVEEGWPKSKHYI
jgi:dolichyl-phosphate-mannose-protein mannosyltransferase